MTAQPASAGIAIGCSGAATVIETVKSVMFSGPALIEA